LARVPDTPVVQPMRAAKVSGTTAVTNRLCILCCLTFDMSGGRRQAQPAGGRPLAGRVGRHLSQTVNLVLDATLHKAPASDEKGCVDPGMTRRAAFHAYQGAKVLILELGFAACCRADLLMSIQSPAAPLKVPLSRSPLHQPPTTVDTTRTPSGPGPTMSRFASSSA
jgi:hypothetical protein